MLAEIHGTDQLILKAGKLDSLNLMRSENLRNGSRLGIVHEDPTIQQERALKKSHPCWMSLRSTWRFLARRQLEEKLRNESP